MAGAGYKLFNTGDVLTAAQVNTYLQEQSVMRFANSTARTTALSGVLAEGMMSYLDDTNSVEVYNGSSWVSIGGTGDITGVTAGTGISGGGTSGDVTITNSMATAIDAKGDLIVGTGADTFARLAIGGTNGHILTVDSGESTGMKWAAASSTPTFVGCGLNKTSDQSISNDVSTAITFTAEDFDTDAFHSTSTNTARITIPSGKGGKYLIYGYLAFQDNATGSRAVNVNLNGTTRISTFARIQAVTESGTNTTIGGSFIYNLVAGDYIELQGYQKSGGSLNVLGSASPDDWRSRFGVYYLGA